MHINIHIHINTHTHTQDDLELINFRIESIEHAEKNKQAFYSHNAGYSPESPAPIPPQPSSTPEIAAKISSEIAPPAHVLSVPATIPATSTITCTNGFTAPSKSHSVKFSPQLESEWTEAQPTASKQSKKPTALVMELLQPLFGRKRASSPLRSAVTSPKGAGMVAGTQDRSVSLRPDTSSPVTSSQPLPNSPSHGILKSSQVSTAQTSPPTVPQVLKVPLSANENNAASLGSSLAVRSFLVQTPHTLQTSQTCATSPTAQPHSEPPWKETAGNSTKRPPGQTTQTVSTWINASAFKGSVSSSGVPRDPRMHTKESQPGAAYSQKYSSAAARQGKSSKEPYLQSVAGWMVCTDGKVSRRINLSSCADQAVMSVTKVDSAMGRTVNPRTDGQADANRGSGSRYHDAASADNSSSRGRYHDASPAQTRSHGTKSSDTSPSKQHQGMKSRDTSPSENHRSRASPAENFIQVTKSRDASPSDRRSRRRYCDTSNADSLSQSTKSRDASPYDNRSSGSRYTSASSPQTQSQGQDTKGRDGSPSRNNSFIMSRNSSAESNSSLKDSCSRHGNAAASYPYHAPITSKRTDLETGPATSGPVENNRAGGDVDTVGNELSAVSRRIALGLYTSVDELEHVGKYYDVTDPEMGDVAVDMYVSYSYVPGQEQDDDNGPSNHVIRPGRHIDREKFPLRLIIGNMAYLVKKPNDPVRGVNLRTCCFLKSFVCTRCVRVFCVSRVYVCYARVYVYT
jgi:hypothetical protein